MIRVSLPESLTEIAAKTFKNCVNLAQIRLPGNLRRLGFECFAGTALRDVMVPASVQAVEERAFADCKQLVAVNFVPEGQLEYIDETAFDGASVDVSKFPGFVRERITVSFTGNRNGAAYIE